MTHIDLTPIAETVPQHVDRVTMPHGDGEPRNTRFSAWTRSALRDMVYCGAVFAWSIAAFTILVAGIAATASLLFLLVGVFAWIGFAHSCAGPRGSTASSRDGSATSGCRPSIADQPRADSCAT
jgi:hypothetical protein